MYPWPFIKATEIGIWVYFVQMLGRPSRSKTNSIPAFSASSVRPLSPLSCSSRSSAISTCTSTLWPKELMRTNVDVGCSALASSGRGAAGVGAVVVSGGGGGGVVVALFSVVFSAVSSGASLLSPESSPPQLAKRSNEASKGVRAAAIESLIGGGLYMVLPEASKFPRTRHTGSPVSENAPYRQLAEQTRYASVLTPRGGSGQHYLSSSGHLKCEVSF